MKYFKYIIFIIFGILLFLLLNTTDTFSIGNQYKLDLTGTGATRSNVVLKTMYDTIVREQNICMDDFEQCQITMRSDGGSCQINTLIGLYQTTLGVPFSQQDQDYINSKGLYLSNYANLFSTYDYLTNRASMIPLLRHNDINSNVPIMNNRELLHNQNIRDFELNHLYPLYIGFLRTNPPLFFREDDTPYSFGHNLLMYKTNYAGLSSFLDYLDSQSADRSNLLYVDLLEKKTQLERLPNINIRNNGIVCIMIDFCNKLFYAVTEFSNPSTLDPNLFDASGNIPEIHIERYNDLWRVKLFGTYASGSRRYSVIKFTNASDDELIRRNLRDLTPNDLLLSPTDNQSKFVKSFIFHSYLHEYKNYDADGSVPVIKNRDDFLGFSNTLCRDSEPRCRDAGYDCINNFPVNNGQYDVCKLPGQLHSRCRYNQSCDNDLYCDTTDNICKQPGQLNNRCRPEGDERGRCEPRFTCDTLNDICVNAGELNEPCRPEGDARERCNHDLYCDNANICKQPGQLNNRCRASEQQCDRNLQCISGFCRYDLLLYNDDAILNPDNSILFDGSYIYNTNRRPDEIIREIILYRDITDFTVPIYLGKYTKTAIDWYGRDMTRDFFIKYDSSNLVLIYGDLVIPTSVFTGKRKKTIRSSNFWKVGKHDNDDLKFITIYFNDDTYTSLSPTSSTTTIDSLLRILQYLDLVLKIKSTRCSVSLTQGSDLGGSCKNDEDCNSGSCSLIGCLCDDVEGICYEDPVDFLRRQDGGGSTGGGAMIQTYLVRIYIDPQYDRIDVDDPYTNNGIINDVVNRQINTVILGWRGMDIVNDILDMDGNYQQFKYYQVTTSTQENAIRLAREEDNK